MVQLLDTEIRTREVLEWQGIHVFHTPMSSCSQKLRMCLGLKQLPWTSHPIDPLQGENLTPYYLGINPRGLIPALVMDGEVHIESNDIILALERRFPSPALVPSTHLDSIATLLRHEDELHLDLRTVSFRFLVRPTKPPKSEAELDAYRQDGRGTIGGQADVSKEREIAFWRQFLDGGISDEVACRSVARFRAAFDTLDEQLRDREFLLGDTISVLDLAWAVYLHRLMLCGYPAWRLHSRLGDWYDRLSRRPAISRELAVAGELPKRGARTQTPDSNPNMEQLCGL